MVTPEQAISAKHATPMSALEELFAQHARALRIDGGMVREHKFAPDRKWRFDFAWPAIKVAVEIEGGTHSGGRHTRGAGFAADLTKYNRAAIMGWLVLRYDGSMVRSGLAAQDMERIIGNARSVRLRSKP